MDEKTLEKSDKGIGLEFEVKKNTPNANRIGFSNTVFDVGEKVYVISESQRFELMKKIDDYESEIKKLKDEIANGNNDKQLRQKDDQIQKLKNDNAEIPELKSTIDDLKNDNSKKDEFIKELTLRVNTLGKELDESKSNPKVYDNDEIEELKEELSNAKAKCKYWKGAYESIIESSDALAAENETLRKDNQQLKDANTNINETNKLLNDNIIGLNNNYKETKDELQVVFDKKENELKETIKIQQTHIDELTQKVETLSSLKEYIPPKQHYDELDKLKDNVNEAKAELDKLQAEVDMKLSKQKSEIEIKNTEEKAQMLLAYNQEINSQKLKYNKLAEDYNHLLVDASSLTRVNTLFNGRHNSIVKDKKPVELEKIEVEKEPSETIEYVPKDEVTLI